jgi:HEAT repeat protein
VAIGAFLLCVVMLLAWRIGRGERASGIGITDIRQLGQQGADAVPRLIKILETKDTVLDSAGRMVWPYVPPRWKWFPNPNQRTWNRCAASQMLGALGPEAKSALPALYKALGDSSADVAVSARIAIAQINEGQ